VNITELKKHLIALSKEELVKEISNLYRKNNFVKDYYMTKYSSDDGQSILIKYKNMIENEFFPEFGIGEARLSVAKKSIAEFKKLSNDAESIAELMVFYVETGVRYTDCYGDINESFYMSMESMFERAANFIVDQSLGYKFKDRCMKIVDDTINMGWGFHDELGDIYFGHFDE
jgi:hypothetical protein